MSSEYDMTVNFDEQGAEDVQSAVQSNIDTIKEYYATIKAGQEPSDDLMQSYKDARGEIVQQNRSYNALRLGYQQQYEGVTRLTSTMAVTGRTIGQVNTMWDRYNTIQIRINTAHQNLIAAQQAVADSAGKSAAVQLKAQDQLKKAQDAVNQANSQATQQYITMGLQLATTLPEGIVKSITSIQTYVASLGEAEVAEDGMTESSTAMGAAMDFALGPVGLAIIAITAIAAAFIWAYENVKPFRDLVNGLASDLMGLLHNALTIIEADVQLWIDGFKLLWTILQPIVEGLEKVGGVISGIGGAVGGAFKSVGLAEGGIVTRPTSAIIGEAGPEAVIPLSQMGGGIGGGGNGASRIDVNINIESATLSDPSNLDDLANAVASKISQKMIYRDNTRPRMNMG